MNVVKSEVSWLPSPLTFTTEEKDRAILRQAYEYGVRLSPDPSTKNGAILIGVDGNIITCSTNKFPNGIAETEERLTNKLTKYRLVVHAESGAVFNAARCGEAVYGSTLYCPFYACSECAKAIIQGGIRRVVGHAQLMTLASAHTTWVKSIINAWNMLHEAGIKCDLYDGIIGVTTRFNGKDIEV